MTDRAATPSSADSRSMTRWFALPAAIGLIALVALASRSADSAALSWALPQDFALTVTEVVGYVALGVGFALLPAVAILVVRRRRAQPLTGRRKNREVPAAPLWARILGLAVAIAVVAGQAVIVLAYLGELQRARAAAGAGAGGLDPGVDPALAPLGRDLTSLTIALVILTAIAVLVVALVIRWRFGAETASAASADRRAVAVRAVDDSLEALRREADPRRAVIAAYVAMERSLARAGLGREEPEAPFEYVRRILARVAGGAQDLRTITELFQLARFSDHPVSDEMRTTAIAALERVRSRTLGAA